MEQLFKDLLWGFWFFLPGGFANAAPVFASRIPGLRKLSQPIDQGKSFRGKRLLGNNKTWRGLLCGIIVGLLSSIALYLVSETIGIQDIVYVPGSVAVAGILGALLGFGALLGDAVESFFKRQYGIASGKSWMPFDQIDYVMGGLLLASIMVPASAKQFLITAVIWILIHPIATTVAWLLRLKDSPF